MTQAAEAHRYAESGGKQASIVISVAQGSAAPQRVPTRDSLPQAVTTVA
jgi:hypothetical protein